jgi:hypothetical protein
MSRKVLILGAYGTFGKRIAKSLAKANVYIIIAGRNSNKVAALAKEINNTIQVQVETAVFDINNDFANQLAIIKPYLVINTCGPFQSANYNVAEICIKQAVHYIDLADGRDFVNGISAFDKKAKENNVLLISGASTLPALSSAVVDHYLNKFSTINSLKYGISPGQKTERGLATMKAILSYLGKPIKPYHGANHKVYGWQNLYRQNYPTLGKRWMSTCDIPDLDLLPPHYGLKSIQFSAGTENSVLHLCTWLLSWLIRLGLPLNLSRHAKTLLKMSHWFDYFGTADGGMHMILRGLDVNHKPLTISWFIIAKNGDGPEIPTIPAIILTKKLLNNEIDYRGATPCVSLITLDEYLAELKNYDVSAFSTSQT